MADDPNVLEFNIEDFRLLYPRFADLSDEVLTLTFKQAALFVGNPGRRNIQPLEKREAIIFALMCHRLTKYLDGINGAAGPVSNATEGSVSIGFAIPSLNNHPYWYSTSCGQEFIALMAPYIYGGVQYTPPFAEPWG